MQLEFFIPLVLFLNILRLWGRRKVHSPPTPFLMHYNPSPLNLLLPSHFFRVPFTFSSKKELFALRDPQSTLHRGASPSPTHVCLCFWFPLSSALPGALSSRWVWVIE